MADIFNMLDTWNAGATVFTGIKLAVTDTASAAGSLLMDLQVGGVSQFKVSKTGTLTTPGSLVASIDVYWGRFLQATSTSATITWGDLILARDAANTLAQRNGVNAQAFNLYNTYTDASNYERLSVSYASNICRIETAQAGTGASRLLLLRGQQLFLRTGVSGNGVGWQVDGNGNLMTSSDNAIDIGGVADTRPRHLFMAGYQQLSEITAPAAPATNGVRIYAEDDGSGKTRLMARFATGAAVQIAIEP